MNKYYTKLKPIDLAKYENFKLLGTQYVCAGTLSTYSHVDIDSSIIIPLQSMMNNGAQQNINNLI